MSNFKNLKNSKNGMLLILVLVLAITLSCAHSPQIARKTREEYTFKLPISVAESRALNVLKKEHLHPKILHINSIHVDNHPLIYGKGAELDLQFIKEGENQTTMIVNITSWASYAEPKLRKAVELIKQEFRKRPILIPEKSGFSKIYDCEYTKIFRLVMNTLQDFGFLVTEVNDKVGLILAEREPHDDKVVFCLAYGVADRYIEKANVSIEPVGVERKKSKVKLILQSEALYGNKLVPEIFKKEEDYDRFFIELDRMVKESS